ncbi:hypothetical protein CSUI_006746 [Cystoisospora suis]|uniref:intramembrane prenyl-peptidase Rce1 n=1 Tax=Cystoisospora suis TaxID=483139 RepID=A0A2C6JYT0_9APIC|nr:hypothetical protein CSUI_006746 [Cystoisospora suis]
MGDVACTGAMASRRAWLRRLSVFQQTEKDGRLEGRWHLLWFSAYEDLFRPPSRKLTQVYRCCCRCRVFSPSLLPVASMDHSSAVGEAGGPRSFASNIAHEACWSVFENVPPALAVLICAGLSCSYVVAVYIPQSIFFLYRHVSSTGRSPTQGGFRNAGIDTHGKQTCAEALWESISPPPSGGWSCWAQRSNAAMNSSGEADQMLEAVGRIATSSVGRSANPGPVDGGRPRHGRDTNSLSESGRIGFAGAHGCDTASSQAALRLGATGNVPVCVTFSATAQAAGEGRVQYQEGIWTEWLREFSSLDSCSRTSVCCRTGSLLLHSVFVLVFLLLLLHFFPASASRSCLIELRDTAHQFFAACGPTASRDSCKEDTHTSKSGDQADEEQLRTGLPLNVLGTLPAVLASLGLAGLCSADATSMLSGALLSLRLLAILYGPSLALLLTPVLLRITNCFCRVSCNTFFSRGQDCITPGNTGSESFASAKQARGISVPRANTYSATTSSTRAIVQPAPESIWAAASDGSSNRQLDVKDTGSLAVVQHERATDGACSTPASHHGENQSGNGARVHMLRIARSCQAFTARRALFLRRVCAVVKRWWTKLYVRVVREFWSLARACIVAPLMEEFLFRGVFVALLICQLGRHYTCTLVSFFFALAHVHHALVQLVAEEYAADDLSGVGVGRNANSEADREAQLPSSEFLSCTDLAGEGSDSVLRRCSEDTSETTVEPIESCFCSEKRMARPVDAATKPGHGLPGLARIREKYMGRQEKPVQNCRCTSTFCLAFPRLSRLGWMAVQRSRQQLVITFVFSYICTFLHISSVTRVVPASSWHHTAVDLVLAKQCPLCKSSPGGCVPLQSYDGAAPPTTLCSTLCGIADRQPDGSVGARYPLSQGESVRVAKQDENVGGEGRGGSTRGPLLMAAVVLHAGCNLLQLPDLSPVTSPEHPLHRWGVLIGGAYLGATGAFVYSLLWLDLPS